MPVVDSSVIAAFFLNEETRPAIEALLAGESTAKVPDFAFVEVSNAIWKRNNRNEISEIDALKIQNEIKLSLKHEIFEIVASRNLLEKALRISMKRRISVYDSLFIALTKNLRSKLFTLDERQRLVAKQERVETVGLD
ncbi:MAG: type II toxin-antitoxin system VapC family toxin [Nitrososphaerales archaeon]